MSFWPDHRIFCDLSSTNLLSTDPISPEPLEYRSHQPVPIAAVSAGAALLHRRRARERARHGVRPCARYGARWCARHGAVRRCARNGARMLHRPECQRSGRRARLALCAPDTGKGGSSARRAVRVRARTKLGYRPVPNPPRRKGHRDGALSKRIKVRKSQCHSVSPRALHGCHSIRFSTPSTQYQR